MKNILFLFVFFIGSLLPACGMEDEGYGGDIDDSSRFTASYLTFRENSAVKQEENQLNGTYQIPQQVFPQQEENQYLLTQQIYHGQQNLTQHVLERIIFVPYQQNTLTVKDEETQTNKSIVKGRDLEKIKKNNKKRRHRKTNKKPNQRQQNQPQQIQKKKITKRK